MKPLFSIRLASALWTAAAVPALANGGAEIAVPANLQSSATRGQAMELHARGVQIYTCMESPATPGKDEWTFSAPEADLFDANQRVATQAGKAPAEGCDREHPGSMARVPYQAIHRMYSTM